MDIIDDLIALTAAAVAARKDATITNPASPNILAHPPPQMVQLRKTPDHGKDTVQEPTAPTETIGRPGEPHPNKPPPRKPHRRTRPNKRQRRGPPSGNRR